MHPSVFYFFATLTLLCATLVIANPLSRNPVTSAMFLILTIMSMAGLFILLHAFFLAAVQVLVYAGAVMVLFLFVIMLLDLREEERRKIKLVMASLAVLAVATIAAIMVQTIRQSTLREQMTPPTAEGWTSLLGTALFTRYELPFELVSLLLLVAMMGTILLSKRDTR